MTAAPSPVPSLTFAAWRPGPPPRYVPLAELLVRLGSFGLGLTWKVDLPDAPHGWIPSHEWATARHGIGTLRLLALVTPEVQFVDGNYDGYDADGRLVLELQEFDSTSWDVRSVDPWVLDEVRRWFPDARPSPPGAWGELPA
ncbi:hypothetical protein ACWGF3_16440 [Streptomyces xanthophaeus]|uniref:hypothetical protein n=1 Tax=Streptomyces xanthophaeus TaxID=67385 RepID=UPI000AEB9FE2|nr:hypothetical protein [Streptomyces xanthophaeus]